MNLKKDFDPFSQEYLNRVFKVSPKFKDRLQSRECETIEFKQSFNWGSRESYARTMAAFANAKGGYIVFGIGDKPRSLIGLKNQSFDNLDTEKVTELLNQVFVPEIDWDMHVFELHRKSYGLLYVYESLRKPVICQSNLGKTIKESDIYYRYRGRTERIKYPELAAIFDALKERERNHWLERIKQLATIGIENAAVLDLKTGIAAGSGGKLIIDESLLSQLDFIKEGEFDEREGIPVIKITGEATPIQGSLIQPTESNYIATGIRTPDIIEAFLGKKKVNNPKEFIKQICFESSAFLPVYYYANMARITLPMTITLVKEVRNNSPSKRKLLERLEEGIDLKETVKDTGTPAAENKLRFREMILKGKTIRDISPRKVKYLLQSIRSLNKQEVIEEYILALLNEIYHEFYSNEDKGIGDQFRRTICYVDELIYKGD